MFTASEDTLVSYLNDHKGTYYSPRTLAKRLNLKIRVVVAIGNQSSNIKKLTTGEKVGCGSSKLTFFYV